jgi:hypothetical protein
VLLPSVTLLPGQSISSVVDHLRRIGGELEGLGMGNADEVLQAYQKWATQAAQTLGGMFDTDNVERLVLTRRHWALMGIAAAYNPASTLSMFRGEQADRGRVLSAVAEDLVAFQKRFTSMPPDILVADTNVYLHHEQYFDEIDWRGLCGAQSDVRLLVPIAVVRELDKHKRSAKNITVSDTNKELIRTRARVTARRLRELFVDPGAVAKLVPGVEAELLLDPLDHRPLADPDTEIVDRVLVAQSLSGMQVSIVTDDGGMQFSARSTGLGVIAPFKDMGEKP